MSDVVESRVSWRLDSTEAQPNFVNLETKLMMFVYKYIIIRFNSAYINCGNVAFARAHPFNEKVSLSKSQLIIALALALHDQQRTAQQRNDRSVACVRAGSTIDRRHAPERNAAHF